MVLLNIYSQVILNPLVIVSSCSVVKAWHSFYRPFLLTF